MARPKKLEVYPNREYGALWSRVATTKKAITLPMEAKKAIGLRHEFYAWKRVACEQPELAAALGINVAHLDEVRLGITEAGLKLYHRDDAPGVAEIRALLGSSIPQTPVPIPVPVAANEGHALSQAEIEAIFAKGGPLGGGKGK